MSNPLALKPGDRLSAGQKEWLAIWAIFHRCWEVASSSREYVKADWIALQRRLEALQHGDG